MASGMKTKRGDSTDIYEVGVTGVSGCRADIAVLDPVTLEEVIGKFSITGTLAVAFSPAQTALLPEGTYTVVCEIIKEVDSVVTFRRELNWSLEILPSLINN